MGFNDLFDDPRLELCKDAYLLKGFALPSEADLKLAIAAVAAISPFRHMGTAWGPMSVAMTNCGQVGWVSDPQGYRYDTKDPLTGLPWPDMPDCFRALAIAAATEAGFADFQPDACLVNRYRPGAALGVHRDQDEANFKHPIVSVSLGIPANFQFGGRDRKDPMRTVPLEHGDVVVWGGVARLNYHGVPKLKDAVHPFCDNARINLTFRCAR